MGRGPRPRDLRWTHGQDRTDVPLARHSGRAGRQGPRAHRDRRPRRHEGEAPDLPAGLAVLHGHGAAAVLRHARGVRDLRARARRARGRRGARHPRRRRLRHPAGSRRLDGRRRAGGDGAVRRGRVGAASASTWRTAQPRRRETPTSDRAAAGASAPAAASCRVIWGTGASRAWWSCTRASRGVFPREGQVTRPRRVRRRPRREVAASPRPSRAQARVLAGSAPPPPRSRRPRRPR